MNNQKTMAKSKSKQKPPNLPSTTGKPSGKKRSNSPAKPK